MSVETVAEAWMRGYAAGFNLYLRTGMTFKDWLLLCDRLEAASKHERELRRNCDVGTEEEQVSRYIDFCAAHHCNSCPARATNLKCQIRWMRMPYTHIERKAAK